MTAPRSRTSGLSGLPTASGLTARLIVELLEQQGLDPAPLLREAGVSRQAVVDRQRVSASSQVRLLDLASQATGDNWIGLTLAGGFDLREMGLIYYVAASSTTLGDALRRVSRYSQVGNESILVTLRDVGGFSIELGYSGVERHRDRHQVELMSYSILRLCRHLAGNRVTPNEVFFAHHRGGDLRPGQQIFGCDLTFSAMEDQIRFPESVAKLRLVTSDHYLNTLMQRMCEQALEARNGKCGNFRTVVENTIAPLLPHGDATSAIVSEKLGMTERTFARRLSQEGLTFTLVLDEIRKDLMFRYLEQGVSIGQIAWLLGFLQTTSLNHACRRWIGKSPSQWQRSLMRG